MADPRARRGEHPDLGVLPDAPANLRLVRFCFAKREETLRQAAERLCAI